MIMKPLLLIATFIATMPSFAQLPAIHSGVYHWNELPMKADSERESRKILEGTTPEFSYFEIHATTQFEGVPPRPAHTQEDIEEVIIIKEGTLKGMLGDQTAELGKGSVMLIPPHVSQAVENLAKGPTTYYVLMFRSAQPQDLARSEQAGGALMIRADTIQYSEKNDRGTEKYFDRPTATCSNYEMHVTTLKKKGPSHDAHTHVDTEIILVMEGEVEMTIEGKTFRGGPGDLFIAESGDLHQVSNATDKPCRYFAFKWRS